MAKLDLDKHLKIVQDSIIYDGDEEMRCYIPDSFKGWGGLTVTNDIETLGIMELRIGPDKCTLKVLAFLKMKPSNIIAEVIEGQPCTVCVFNKGDVFISNRFIVKNSSIVSNLFNQMLSLGKIPYFFKYEDLATLFDNSYEHADFNFGFSHIVFELATAQLYRDPDNVNIPFRLSDKKVGRFTHLKNVIEAPQSATSKLLGSYFDDGLTGAMTIDNPVNTKIEDILRY